MNFNDFLNKAATPSDEGNFRKAASSGVDCAWRARVDTRDKSVTVEYAVRGKFDPVFTLLATGKYTDNKIQTNFDPGQMGEDAKGICKHLDSIKIPVKVDQVKSPTLNGTKYKLISLESQKLRSALANRFLLPASSNPVLDLRSETRTPKVEGVKDYSQSGTHTVPRLYMSAAFTLLGNHKRIQQGSNPDREGVVAIIADQRGNIVSWGLKNQDVDCWHGETISAIRLGGQLPQGAVVFSSLKPCHMCSGVLYAVSGGNARVYWGMDDPRVHGKTVLESKSLGGTLGASQAAQLKAKALLCKPGNAKSNVATSLLNAFNNQKQTPSAIDFSADDSGPASKLFKQVESNLGTKVKAYQSSDKAVNTHVAAALQYLDGFLRNQAKVIG